MPAKEGKPRKSGPKKASLRTSLVKDLRLKLKAAKANVRNYSSDLRSLGVGRKSNAKKVR